MSGNETIPTDHSQNPLQIALHPRQQTYVCPGGGQHRGRGNKLQDLQLDEKGKIWALFPECHPDPGDLPFLLLPSVQERALQLTADHSMKGLLQFL